MRSLILSCAVLLGTTLPAVAQTRGSRFNGIDHGQQHAFVTGADVSVRGSDATFRFTTEVDGAFRFLNLEPGTYTITATLSGFRSAVRDVVVAVGRNVDAPMELRVAPIIESVTVSAPAPILDATATGTATTFSSDELAKIPTSRDPFSLVRSVPGVLLDRVNVGGNETGQRSEERRV